MRYQLVAVLLIGLLAACTPTSRPSAQAVTDVTSTIPLLSSTVASPTASTASMSPSALPSQSEAEARRDGVIPELAALSFESRVSPLVEAPAEEGTWMLSRLPDDLINASWADGCGFGDLEGDYPTEVICTDEYGEILLVGPDGEIVKAYPMPGAIPTWIQVNPHFVYAGRTGDGGLPDSTLVRIDRVTLEAVVMLIPATLDGDDRRPPNWHIASEDQVEKYRYLVSSDPAPGMTKVESWIGDLWVDIEGVDAVLDA